MQSIFKRGAIGLVIFGMAGSSLAMYGIPCITGVFIGADGLYLRPQNGDLDFVTVIPATAGDSFITDAVITGYQWDWRIYGGIKFRDCDDFTISWLHLNQNYGNRISTFNPGSDNFLLQSRWVGTGNAFVDAVARFKLDEAYLVWGHTERFNTPWSMRWAAGVEYARLDADLDIERIDGPATSIVFYESEGESVIKGWGPRLELDVNYGVGGGLAWFLRTNAVLLSVEREIELESFPPISATAVSNPFSSAGWTERHVIIPKFGMKIGASYSAFWGKAGSEGCEACGTTLTAEIGWQADIYIHAIERPDADFSAFVPSSSMIPTTVSNFSDQGMFVGLKLASDWFV